MSLDFKAIREHVPTERLIPYLQLQMNREEKSKDGVSFCVWRGTCPACKSNPRALVITENRGWTCFHRRGENGKWPGGDSIAFLAHVKDMRRADGSYDLRWAALELHNHFLAGMQPVASAVERVVQKADDHAEKLQRVKDKLLHEHPEVEALGLTPDQAKALGIGYVVRSTVGAGVLLPCFVSGELMGYCSYNPERTPPFVFSKKLLERL